MTSGRTLLHGAEPGKHSHNPLVRYFKVLGPGLVTGASDDDPSGITTYSVAGAALGYGMLWTALATYPLMAAVQLVCARIGLLTGEGLAAVLRRHYPRPCSTRSLSAGRRSPAAKTASAASCGPSCSASILASLGATTRS